MTLEFLVVQETVELHNSTVGKVIQEFLGIPETVEPTAIIVESPMVVEAVASSTKCYSMFYCILIL